MKKIIISGGSGLIGQALCRQFLADGHHVSILSRGLDKMIQSRFNVISWDGKTYGPWAKAIDGADVVINLSGQNIGDSRWTPARKKMIIDSRIQAGKALTQACEKAVNKPGLFIQASAIGYYGTRQPGKLDESATAGEDFLAKLGKEWEDSTRPVESLGTRRIVVRNGLVLSREGGVLNRLTLPFKFFAGGRLGSGGQWYSWIHIDDVVGAIKYMMDNDRIVGVCNLTAPAPVTMDNFGRSLGRVMNRPYWLPVPGFALRMALGEMSMLVLEGQRVFPRNLLEAGYVFRYSELGQALDNLIGTSLFH